LPGKSDAGAAPFCSLNPHANRAAGSLKMLRRSLCSAAGLLICTIGTAPATERPTAFDEMIARYAKAHGVPEAFVHRMIMRESRYNPRIVHKNCYGLLQIKPATARSMGFGGDPRALLDPETDLTYAVPYLANAFRIAGGNEVRATALYSGGYHSTAKRKKCLEHCKRRSQLRRRRSPRRPNNKRWRIRPIPADCVPVGQMTPRNQYDPGKLSGQRAPHLCPAYR
jgi:Transglycosylase SLT domain